MPVDTAQLSKDNVGNVPPDNRASTKDALSWIMRGIESLSHTALDSLPGEERLALAREIAAARTRLEALRGTLLVTMQQKNDHVINGDRSILDTEVQTSRESAPEVRRTIERAKSLSDLPLFDAALKRASISPRHVDLLRVEIREPKLKAQLSDSRHGEQYLLDLAERFPADMFRRKLKAWAIRFAPKKAEVEHQTALREETLAIVESDGGWAVRGWLSKLSGAALNTVLQTMMFSSKPQLGFDKGTAAGGQPGDIQNTGDIQGNAPANTSGLPNTTAAPDNPEPSRVAPPQLRAQALTALAKYILDHGFLQPEARVRPHISVHVPLSTLEGVERAAAEAALKSRAEDGTLETANTLDTAKPSGAAWDSRAVGQGFGTGGMCIELAEGFGYFDEGPGGNCFEHERTGRCLDRTDRLRKRIGSLVATIRSGFDEDLLTGLEPPETNEGIPLSASEFATIMCGSELRRIVLSSESEVLDVGRKYRVATAAQTRAVIARDRTCRYPNCHRPPGDGQVHHSFEWEHGGSTDIDNLVLLCWHHHQYLHAHNIDVHHHTGGFIFKRGNETIGVSLKDEDSMLSAA